MGINAGEDWHAAISEVPNFEQGVRAAAHVIELRRGRKLAAVLRTFMGSAMIDWSSRGVASIPKSGVAVIVARQKDRLVKLIVAHILDLLLVEVEIN